MGEIVLVPLPDSPASIQCLTDKPINRRSAPSNFTAGLSSAVSDPLNQSYPSVLSAFVLR